MNDTAEMLTADRRRLLKEHLMSEIARDSMAKAPGPRRRLGWLVVPPLVVGLAVAVVLVSPAKHSTTHPAPAASENPTQTLSRAAKAAASRQGPEVRDNQFIYQRIVDDGGSLPKHERKEWWAADGRSNGMIEDAAQFARPENPTGRIGWSQGWPTPDGPPPPSIRYPTYKYLASLPTDPQQLLQRVYAEGNGKAGQPDMAAFRDIQRLFEFGLPTPAVGGALMEAAAQIPGTTVAADETDAAGRHGVAVVASDDTYRWSLIFDRNTGEYLGGRSVLIHDLPPIPATKNGSTQSSATPGRKAGEVFMTAVLQVAVTDHAGDAPKG